MHRPSSQHGLIRATALAGGFALILVMSGFALLAVGYEHLYSGRLYPGVRILGVDASGMTYAEARTLAATRATHILEQRLELVFTDQSMREITTPRLLGLGLDPDQLTQAAYLTGREGSFLERSRTFLVLKTSGAAFAFTPSFEPAGILEKLAPLLVSHEIAAADASLTISDDEITITNEILGREIDRPALQELLANVLSELDVPPTVTVPMVHLAPRVTAADLQPILAEAERITNAGLTLAVEDQAVSVSAAMLASWLTIDTSRQPITLTWNSDLIETFLAERVAPRVDEPMTPRKIEKDTGKILSEGSVGRSLDQAAGVAAILAHLRGRQEPQAPIPVEAVTIALTVIEEPIEERTVVPPFTPGLYAGKYVEINLSEQTLYQWEGQTLLASFTVSTGKWSAPTPQGVLYIKNHIPYAYSRKYDLYMPYWLGLARDPDGGGYEGYGIHELPEWRGGRKEGENHLGTPVSHGCIRLGIGPAEAIYTWAEEGMPVYIHT
ncbi:L,D-transpeptidase/peptidoglycan binding protein [Candidatus Berkelbacteria bacterium]|nr:L,D-transpeptidase/peptidoglycan binding protein [Candidatus Berkelbacteria bacterium]